MNWRPEGWEKIKQSMCVHCQGISEAGIEPATCATCPTEPMICNMKGEALVDAMLEGLIANNRLLEFGDREITVKPKCKRNIILRGKGSLIIIPEDE